MPADDSGQSMNYRGLLESASRTNPDLSYPVFEEVSAGPDHSRVWQAKCEVQYKNKLFRAVVKSGTKKLARQRAATEVYKQYMETNPPVVVPAVRIASRHKRKRDGYIPFSKATHIIMLLPSDLKLTDPQPADPLHADIHKLVEDLTPEVAQSLEFHTFSGEPMELTRGRSESAEAATDESGDQKRQKGFTSWRQMQQPEAGPILKAHNTNVPMGLEVLLPLAVGDSIWRWKKFGKSIALFSPNTSPLLESIVALMHEKEVDVAHLHTVEEVKLFLDDLTDHQTVLKTKGGNVAGPPAATSTSKVESI